MNLSFTLRAALAATLLYTTPTAFAEEPPASPPDRTVTKERVLVVGDNVARFQVTRDTAARRMTFRLADPSVRIENPVIVMTTAEGPAEVKLVSVPDQPHVWTWTDDAVVSERFDGSLRVMVAGKPYTTSLGPVWVSEGGAIRRVPRHSGRLLTLSDCGAEVEVVQDPNTGKLTIYSFEDVVVTEAPVITVSHTTTPVTVTMTQVPGQTGVWVATHETLRTHMSSARIRLLVNGKPCEAPLLFSSRGGRIVSIADSPTWEVVRDPRTKDTIFYAVDETYNGKPYVIESPKFVYGTRTYEMVPVEGTPRAWRVVGLDTAGSTSSDGQLNFTLFGKTLSGRVGLSGLGIDLR